MRILDLFDMYFLTMMVVQGTVILTLDASSFKRSHMESTSKKARILGSSAIIISVILFILRWIF